MFAVMKNFITFIAVLMIGAVSFGATTGADKQEDKIVCIVGSDSHFVEVAKIMAEKAGVVLVITDRVQDAQPDVIKELADGYAAYIHEDPGKFISDTLNYTEKPKHFYTTAAECRPTRGKPIPGKGKHIRQARNAI